MPAPRGYIFFYFLERDSWQIESMAGKSQLPRPVFGPKQNSING